MVRLQQPKCLQVIDWRAQVTRTVRLQVAVDALDRGGEHQIATLVIERPVKLDIQAVPFGSVRGEHHLVQASQN
jgi:hypothetical protein